MPKKIIVLFVSFLVIAGCTTTQRNQEILFEPETLYLAPGSTSADINLSWYADAKNGSVTQVRFFDENGNVAAEALGTVGPASKGKEAHKVSVTALQPDMLYRYSVSNDGIHWSREYAYKTPKAGSFRFAYVGDPQLTLWKQDKNSRYFSADKTTAQAWKDVVKKIAEKRIDFIVSAGDQVDRFFRGREREYGHFFAPQELRSIPVAVTIGNHDRHYLSLYHYNMPNEQKFEPILSAENKKNAEMATVEAAGNYWYLYNKVLFVTLNSAAYPDNVDMAKLYVDRFDKTLYLATTVNKGKYTWLFVQHHKSTVIFQNSANGAYKNYYAEAGFDKLMDKYRVDFVLGGHDHVYARTFALRDGHVVNSNKDIIVNPGGTISLTANTSGGLKYSGGPHDFPESTAVAFQYITPQYTIVDVSDETVSFITYAIDSSTPVDSFRVMK